MIDLHSLPPEAHIEFACPYCERAPVPRTVTLSTCNATHCTATNNRVQFHAIQCHCCGKRMTFEVTPTPLARALFTE